jgi:hypothetical protein
MRGPRGAAALILASLALTACGEDEKFSDGKIADAIDAENDQVGGDPFCAIADYLNDPDEIEKADKKNQPAITSARGGVGVVVKPPFPDDCEHKVRKGLNKLDPREKE